MERWCFKGVEGDYYLIPSEISAEFDLDSHSANQTGDHSYFLSKYVGYNIDGELDEWSFENPEEDM